MSYEEGLDILGTGVGDFLPWMNIISSAAGGATGGKSNPISSIIPGSNASTPASSSSAPSTQEVIKQALDQERQRRAMEKAEADARKMKLIAAGAIGILGLGTLVLVLKR